jgi:FecR protein
MQICNYLNMFNYAQVLKLLSVMSLGIWVATGTASSAESAQKRLPGKVVVANVVGKAEGIEPGSQSPRILKSNDVITEKYTVNVGAASTAILVFSNGSSVNLRENSSLVISEFLQDPFAKPYATTILTEEPTTSVTKLNLPSGEIVCNVKKLRTKEGSSLTVNTPVGAAGVRGTIFAVSYVPDGSGNWIYTLSVTEGEVALTDADGNVTIVPAGKEVVISVRPTKDPRTGAITDIEILSLKLQDIPQERQNMINAEAAKGADAALEIFVDVMDVNLLDAFQEIRDAPPIIMPKPRRITRVDP